MHRTTTAEIGQSLFARTAVVVDAFAFAITFAFFSFSRLMSENERTCDDAFITLVAFCERSRDYVHLSRMCVKESEREKERKKEKRKVSLQYLN